MITELVKIMMMMMVMMTARVMARKDKGRERDYRRGHLSNVNPGSYNRFQTCTALPVKKWGLHMKFWDYNQ